MKRLIGLLFSLLLSSTVLAAEVRQRYLISPSFPARPAGLGLMREIRADHAKYQTRTYSAVNVIGVNLTAQEAAQLRKSGEVRYVDPVVPRYALAERSPLQALPSAGTQSVPYGIDKVRARDVWAVGRGAAGNVHVAVVDTGIDYNHPDLKDRYQGGFNAFPTAEHAADDPFDDHGHGTHVSGTIAATDNTIGVVGVAPEARIWGVKVLGSNGSGSNETVIAGVNWVIAKKREIGGNWVANFSLGAESGSDAERDTFAAATNEGIIVVAAAGNAARDFITVPASYRDALAISAINETDALASFSNYGRGIAFAAPGVGVVSSVKVGTAFITQLVLDQDSLEAVPLVGSGTGEVQAQAVNCGFGAPEDFPADMSGKIALVRRSPPAPPGADCTSIPNACFRDKVRNAVARGAAAVVIIPDERQDRNWRVYLDSPEEANGFPIVITVSNFADGVRLAAEAGKSVLSVSNRSDDYGPLNGTSMATPHVAGSIALAWSLAPNASAQQVMLAAKFSALDLGAQGYDKIFGYGRIDALALARYLAPGLFGVDPPPPATPRGRRIGAGH
jgi:subtilisin family serine protease